eukprot:TRINITY_DN106874_c0_g1_i1.p1 TRINITY_DN106874_c0_g1~~TRINITY_DN106874_c0_g1_i1.p1  ORF type:complete len:535 (+),score=91.20 TRINITY_DN106874_c0_g1_i1:54-1658(+)
MLKLSFAPKMARLALAWLLAAVLVATSNGQVSNIAMSGITMPAGFTTGSSGPTQMVVTFQVAANQAGAADVKIEITASQPIFAAGGTALTHTTDYIVASSGAGNPTSSSGSVVSTTVIDLLVSGGQLDQGPATTTVTLKAASFAANLPPTPNDITLSIKVKNAGGDLEASSTSATLFRVIAAPTVSAPSTAQDGSAPAGTLQVSFKLPIPVNSGTAISITASSAIFTNAQTLTTATLAGVPFGTQKDTTSTSVISLTAAVNGAVGEAVAVTVDNAALANPMPSAGPVTFTIASGGSTFVSAATGFTITAAGGVAASDPVTIFKGRKTKFWLPINMLLPLLETPDLTVFASTFQGPEPDQQWFGRFVVALPNGAKLADITVNERLGLNTTRTRHSSHDKFSQLCVKLDGSTEPIDMTRHSLRSVQGSTVKIGVGSKRFDPPRLHGSPLVEFVHIESPSASFLIHASHAGTEFPDDLSLQAKYAHLDWMSFDLVGVDSFSGILPELWGIQPLSDQVAQMKIPPSQIRGVGQICQQE